MSVGVPPQLHSCREEHNHVAYVRCLKSFWADSKLGTLQVLIIIIISQNKTYQQS